MRPLVGKCVLLYTVFALVDVAVLAVLARTVGLETMHPAAWVIAGIAVLISAGIVYGVTIDFLTLNRRT